jgi:predicted kinase
MEAVIFIGIQGSGKSTFYRDRFFETHVRISLDLLRTRSRERAFLETCLRTRQRFVVDNTNARAADRAGYISAAKQAAFRVQGYFFETALDEALERNRQRRGRARIPVAGVIATFRRLQRPAMAEGFDELYAVFRDKEDQFLVAPYAAADGAGAAAE